MKTMTKRVADVTSLEDREHETNKATKRASHAEGLLLGE
jgi:hypothetical protein